MPNYRNKNKNRRNKNRNKNQNQNKNQKQQHQTQNQKEEEEEAHQLTNAPAVHNDENVATAATSPNEIGTPLNKPATAADASETERAVTAVAAVKAASEVAHLNVNKTDNDEHNDIAIAAESARNHKSTHDHLANVQQQQQQEKVSEITRNSKISNAIKVTPTATAPNNEAETTKTATKETETEIKTVTESVTVTVTGAGEQTQTETQTQAEPATTAAYSDDTVLHETPSRNKKELSTVHAITPPNAEQVQSDIAATTPSAEANANVMGAKNTRMTHTPEATSEETKQTEKSSTALTPTNARKAKIIIHRIAQEDDCKVEIVPKEETRSAEEQRNVKVIIHRIELEDASDNNLNDNAGKQQEIRESYQVESPETVAHSTSFSPENINSVQIQEISDDSSGDCADNAVPLVSEAESEPESLATTTNTMTGPQGEKRHAVSEAATSDDALQHARQEQHQQQQQQNDIKQRQHVQKRIALENHFLPQLLSPRYLDSILEENSDMSDARSDCSDNLIARSESGSSIYGDNEAKAKKANAVFPKSQLDFSRRHRHGPLPKAPQLLAGADADAICEEPTAIVVQTKLVAPNEVTTTTMHFSTLSRELAKEPEAAEVVYINSASSSLSDLMDMDLEDHQVDSADDARTIAIHLDTDVREIISKPLEVITESLSRESTPVNQATYSNTSKATAVASAQSAEIETRVTTTCSDSPEESQNSKKRPNNFNNDEQMSEKAEVPSPTVGNSLTNSSSVADDAMREATQSTNSTASDTFATASSDSKSLCAELTAGYSNQVVENSAIMNSVRDIVNNEMSSVADSVNFASRPTGNSLSETQTTHGDPIIRTAFQNESVSKSESESPPPIPSPPQTDATDHQLLASYNSFKTINQSLSTPHPFNRQESADSHCSDSTSYSQCTAINVCTTPQSDSTDFTNSISDTIDADGLQSNTVALNHDAKDVNSEVDIKKLRLLCAETVAALPYGEQVLEELATVAQSIGEGRAVAQLQHNPDNNKMPYPLPDLPHIKDLQLAISANATAYPTQSPPSKRTNAIKQLSFAATEHPEKIRSPTPPPIPEPPQRYGGREDKAWLGMPTDANPNVLVCFSPAQRTEIEQKTAGRATTNNAQPDQLLDAHQKFVERRGYHEYTAEQVEAINNEKMEEQILQTAAIMKKLRKSLTPPPPPLPPPPVPSKSARTASKAQQQILAKSTTATTTTATKPELTVANDVSSQNANEQAATVTVPLKIDGEEREKHRLLAIIHNNDSYSASGRTNQPTPRTSSHENNSRPTANNNNKQSIQSQQQQPAVACSPADAVYPEQHRGDFVESAHANEPVTETHHIANSHSNKRESEFIFNEISKRTSSMQSVENELAKMFPTIGQANIFDAAQRRYSNIESSSGYSPYCAQLLTTHPKRYSNIETTSYETKKRIENGQVVYDTSDRKHERQHDGVSDASTDRLDGASCSTSTSTSTLVGCPSNASECKNVAHQARENKMTAPTDFESIMSALNLNTTNSIFATTPTITNKAEATTEATSTSTATATTVKTENANNAKQKYNYDIFPTKDWLSECFINRQEERKNSTSMKDVSISSSSDIGAGGNNGIYEEFRQRAKAAAEATSTPKTTQIPITIERQQQNDNETNENNFKAAPSTSTDFEHAKLFRDFDELSKQLHAELERGKAKEAQRNKSTSLYDLSRAQMQFRDHFTELKKQRHEHMQELERGIERSMKSRQSKPVPSVHQPQVSRTFQIPIQMEQDRRHEDGQNRVFNAAGTHNIPIQMDPTYKVETPITPVTPQSSDYDDSARYRRAESMFNLAENNTQYSRQRTNSQNYDNYQQQQQQPQSHQLPIPDDWSRYANDLGSSENIAKPLAREVEICYQRQRPHAIRAPRLSVSTNDLSTGMLHGHSYDNFNAYNVRRTHAPMLSQTPQKNRPHYQSCYSMIERDPNPTYISTTSRRGVSPAPPTPPVPPPPAQQGPLRQPELSQRRASLPREIHEQQLKYITSKEEELKMEFERLHNERRRLMEEMNRTQGMIMPQRPPREFNRPAPKLPTLSEDDRHHMAEEWLNKVAEREERRLQKIIKISKAHDNIGQQEQMHSAVSVPAKPDLREEFLHRVKERRTKLAMPSDSDWESGAESQPVTQGHASETDDASSVKVIVGQSEADLRQLPRHLREFAKFSNHHTEPIGNGGQREVHEEEERRQEATQNSFSSAVKKSSLVKEVKISRPTAAGANNNGKNGADISTGAGQGQGMRSTSHKTNSTHYSQHVQKTQRKVEHLTPCIVKPKTAPSKAQCNTSAVLACDINENCAAPRRNKPKDGKKTRFLLQPNRRSWSENDLLKEIDSELKMAKGFLYADAFERSTSASELYRPFVRRSQDTSHAVYKPNEVIFKVKHEYMSEPETEYDRPRKMAQLGRRQYDGIGPVTNDGMPIILRSEVQEPHQHEWYKRLYQTIHKQKNGARTPYKSNGYQSEPDRSYDSDYSTVKYKTLDRRRLESVSSAANVRSGANSRQDDHLYGTMPNPIKSGQNTYKNQPGRIENYVTGDSSVSEKEKKEWWDEVMDIFNGHLEQTKLSPHYTEGNLSRALAKESGYTSDSNIVFRKKEIPPSSPLSPVEQKQFYKSVQAGGEPPLFGFRKPAPERPKESPNRYYESDVNIHFKTPVRHEYKAPLSEEELTVRQAEQMQKLYQEERRRKYLKELQDMNSKRHYDNFTPSQKSPIPLNRYDDFQSDLAPKSPNTTSATRKAVARALYNFQGQTARELSFRKGDVIYIRRQIDKNWYEGEHNAMIGLLPANYVEIINKDCIRQPQRKLSEGQARAKYNFQAQSGVELSLNKGELVTLTRRVDDNWFEGKIANRKGIFPVSYVEVLTDIGAEDIAAKTVVAEHSSTTLNPRPSLETLRTNINNEFNLITQNGHQPPNGILKETKNLHKTDVLHVDTSTEPLTYRALYKYRPQNTDELELLEGDIVHVLEKCDDGWFVGTSQRTGCFGTFPGNYVERV